MRTTSLAAALAAGALVAACSKPEPAGGAPSPDVVTVDSATTTADSTVTAAVPDSMAKDTTMSAMKDTAATAMPDSAATPDTAMKN